MAERVHKKGTDLLYILEELRELSSHVTVSTALCFVKIALDEGITVGDLMKYLGQAPTSTARAISLLYPKARGKEGIGVIETRLDDVDMRIKHLYLTPKGHKVWNRIERILDK